MGLPGLAPGFGAWLRSGYATVFSMLLGFFAWYHGLALGGVAGVGQVQSRSHLLTLGWSAALLGEPIGLWTVVAALAILICVAATQQVGIRWTHQTAINHERRGAAAFDPLGAQSPTRAAGDPVD